MDELRSIGALNLAQIDLRHRAVERDQRISILSSAALHGLVLVAGVTLSLTSAGGDVGELGRSVRVSLLAGEPSRDVARPAARPSMRLDPAQAALIPSEQAVTAPEHAPAVARGETSIGKPGNASSGSNDAAVGPDLAPLILRCMPIGAKDELVGIALMLSLNAKGELQAPPVVAGRFAGQSKSADRLVQAALQCGPYPLEFAAQDIILASWGEQAEQRSDSGTHAAAPRAARYAGARRGGR